MLSKSHQRKKPASKPAKHTWHFSPSHEVKKIFSILDKEPTPPKPEIMAKIPLLQRWMERSKVLTACKEDSPPSPSAL